MFQSAINLDSYKEKIIELYQNDITKKKIFLSTFKLQCSY